MVGCPLVITFDACRLCGLECRSLLPRGSAWYSALLLSQDLPALILLLSLRLHHLLATLVDTLLWHSCVVVRLGTNLNDSLNNNLMLRINLEYAEHLCSLNLRTAATRRQQFIPTFLRIPDFQYRQLLGSKLLGLLAVGCWLATDELSVPSRLAPSVTPPPSHKRKVKSLVDQRRGPRYQQAVSATP